MVTVDIFYNGTMHVCENMEKLHMKRDAQAKEIIQMCDVLSRIFLHHLKLSFATS